MLVEGETAQCSRCKLVKVRKICARPIAVMALVLNLVKPRSIDGMSEDWTRAKAEVFADFGIKDTQTTNLQMES